MPFALKFTLEAAATYRKLEADTASKKRFKAVHKTLGLLEQNPRHPSLNTHKYTALKGLGGEEIFEAYAENRTPAAYRIFWHYGPDKQVITIINPYCLMPVNCCT